MSQSHFPASLGQPSLNHRVEGNILSISPPSSSIDAPMTTDFGPPRKYTLLSRPQQPLPSSSSLPPPTFQHSLPSSEQLNSGCLNQQIVPPAGPPVTGRAARDDYYDTEDPSVNLQDFIVNSMQAQKNRVVLIKLEEEFVSYVSNPARSEPLKLPPWDSYHRMLAHRVAAYFGLEHNVDPMDKTRVIVGKGPNTRMPKVRFGDYMALSEDPESIEPKLILKRSSKDTSSMDKFEAALASVEPSSDVSVKVLKSYEEREEEYEKARAQIFSQQSPLQSSVPFDLATKTNQRMSSSIFPSVMHHRRAASDTSMFKRVGATADLKKDSSSNHSSRSATPLVTTSLLRLGGSCELLSSSVDSRVQPPMQVQTSPKPVQQQLQTSSILDKPSQGGQFHTPPPASSSTSETSSKFDSSSSQTQHYSIAPAVFTTIATGATPPTSNQYHPLQSSSSVPVVYPQPPAAALQLADPNWYPYQQMMLYQVSPQGYVPTPTHYLSGPGGSPIIPGPVYHPFPGVTGQPLVTPTLTSPPQQLAHAGSGAARLPLAMDQLPSPSHPNSGITLVRPVPQQASPVRLAKVDAAWNFPPAHFNMQQSMLAQQIAMSPGSGQPPPFAASVQHPGSQAKPSLVEQLDTLRISGGDGSNAAVLENEADSANSQQELPPKPPGRKMSDNTSSGDGGEGDSRFVGPGVPRLPHPGNGTFPVGNLPLSAVGEAGVFGGQMISPTHPPEHVQYMQHQMQPPGPVGPVYGAGGQEGGGYVNNPGVLPANPIHFPPGTHSQPSTPTIGPLNLAPPGILQAQQQGIFSPPSTGITRSPVQVLGHTLGTSLFSPPPSTGNQHGLFVNSPTSSGKMGFAPGTPNHPPVGSGTRYRHIDSSKQGSVEVSTPLSSQSGFQSLPPRLAQQHGQKGGGNRYQNQRHPSNRATSVKNNNHSVSVGPVTLGDHMPAQFVSISGGNSSASKREPLLPTPPSTQMVKLDTNLTCGVPVHVMEVVDYPPESSPERAQAFKAVSKLSGLMDLKMGKMNKTGEEVVVAVFSNEEVAMQALQIKHSLFSLSIPRNNHAKFILSLL